MFFGGSNEINGTKVLLEQIDMYARTPPTTRDAQFDIERMFLFLWAVFLPPTDTLCCSFWKDQFLSTFSDCLGSTVKIYIQVSTGDLFYGLDSPICTNSLAHLCLLFLFQF